MMRLTRTAILITAFCSLFSPAFAAHAAKSSSAAHEALLHYVGDLKKNPKDIALREKIIKLVQTMKLAPTVPEDAERNLARGIAYFNKASDSAGYRKAIDEFEAASNSAPWLATAYYNLGVVQEKSGLYGEALQSLKLYLLAAPEAKNARDVKNKIYELEVYAEDQQAGKNAAAGGEANKPALVAGKATLDITPEKQLKILKLPQDRKARGTNFEGSWYFKDALRGEEVTAQAFAISRNAAGDLVAGPPHRPSDYVGNITVFEISGRKLKLQIKWKMASEKDYWYWKTETYDLTLSDDGSKLSGTYKQQSYGGRDVDIDRVLFRQ